MHGAKISPNHEPTPTHVGSTTSVPLPLRPPSVGIPSPPKSSPAGVHFPVQRPSPSRLRFHSCCSANQHQVHASAPLTPLATTQCSHRLRRTLKLALGSRNSAYHLLAHARIR
ncbi:hypothetical protein AXF42_Ash007886 [Apostasia shenzhenica]|uniref:Uncharacterized protein n=1 Tax=Apostasia shenzhenica TaxID=1088818 RepID=A0A2I0B5L8_9ASPA|nr:hypothetical protein AXF42_Ash007886 [Apostasia shenzhenica]